MNQNSRNTTKQQLIDRFKLLGGHFTYDDDSFIMITEMQDLYDSLPYERKHLGRQLFIDWGAENGYAEDYLVDYGYIK